MATDIKKVWFESISSGNVSTVSRLLYATPNPKAGVERIEWLVGESVDIPQHLSKKLHLTDSTKLWSLPFAIISFINSGKSKNSLDIVKIILSSTPNEKINNDIGNGNTVLHLVSATGDMELCRMVLDKCPDSSIQNCQAKGPLDVAAPLGKNMISNYHSNFMKNKNIAQKTQISVESTVIGNKVDVAEAMLKELGIDENDSEAQELKKEILKRSASRERSPVKPPVKVVSLQLPVAKDIGISVVVGSSSNTSMPPVFQERRGRIKEVKAPSNNINTVRKNLNDIFDTKAHESIDKDIETMSVVEKVKEEPAMAESIKEESLQYSATIKRPLLLVDEESKADRLVNFKNSWKGELEKTRKFFADASTVMLSQDLGRPSIISPNSFIPPSERQKTRGRLLLKLKSLRDVVLNCSRTPDASYLYCYVTGSGIKPIKTSQVTFGQENMNTNIPLGTELAIDINDDFQEINLKIDLCVRLEFESPTQQGLFRAESMKNLFRGRSSNGRSSGQRIVSEQKICHLVIPVGKLLKQQKIESKLRWETQREYFDIQLSEQPIKRSESRASIFLKQKIFRNTTKNTIDVVKCEIAETGTLSIDSFYIEDITKEDIDLGNIPIHIDNAIEWCERKKWQETCWFTGYLSQQGGDVKYWRRRFYKLVGSKLLAHHEFTKEFRTSIDLSQVVKLDELPAEVDGESYPTPFSFRLYFKHGEQIDFYAEMKQDYTEWISILKKVLMEMPETLINLPQKYKNSSSSSSSKRRSPKTLSISEIWTSAAAGNELDDNFKSYDKRYKTPAAKKGVSLMKPPSVGSVETENELKLGSSNNSSFVGIFGTQKGTMIIPEL